MQMQAGGGLAFEERTNHAPHTFKIGRLRESGHGLMADDYIVAGATGRKSEGDGVILQSVSNWIAVLFAKSDVEDGGIWLVALNQRKGGLHGFGCKRFVAKFGEPVPYHHGDERLVFEHQDASP